MAELWIALGESGWCWLAVVGIGLGVTLLGGCKTTETKSMLSWKMMSLHALDGSAWRWLGLIGRWWCMAFCVTMAVAGLGGRLMYGIGWLLCALAEWMMNVRQHLLGRYLLHMFWACCIIHCILVMRDAPYEHLLHPVVHPGCSWMSYFLNQILNKHLKHWPSPPVIVC